MRDKEPVTLQAKFGFQDGDLKTPKHDEIMIWLADNILEICAKVLRKKITKMSRVVWEKPIRSDKYTVGFVDLWAEFIPEDSYTECLNFEVKSSIPSLGELIRQITFYQQYCEHREGRFVVVSPDARWQRQLASQGIGFVNSDAPL
jgi:hypothetical protein